MYWASASPPQIPSRDQPKFFKHDLQLAARIVADLEASKGFDKAKPVATIGRVNRDKPYEALQTERFYDIQVSNFGSDWSKEAILEEASGIRFVHPSALFREAGEEICQTLRPIDGYYETIVADGGAIVCLVDLRDSSEITDP